MTVDEEWGDGRFDRLGKQFWTADRF